MSEYQYYEFCRIQSPLTAGARKHMGSLSSRARIGTHTASYVYHYSDFKGNIRQCLLDYFDVFFYIANWGTVRLLFKYVADSFDVESARKYVIEDVIMLEQAGENVLLDICIDDESGGGDSVEGEGLLPELLPLYHEISHKNYQLLELIASIYDGFDVSKAVAENLVTGNSELTLAQRAFINIFRWQQAALN